MQTMFTSKGQLKYSKIEDKYKLIVSVDEEIVRYYRSLIPKWFKVNPQMHRAHISVVRNEVPPKMEFWGKYEGEIIEFCYESIIRQGSVYWWLNVFCKRLEEIRLELGLPVSSPYTLPPEEFTKCWHISLGNQKELHKNA